MDVYKNIALECGFREEDIDAIQDPYELNKMLAPVVNRRFISKLHNGNLYDLTENII